MKKKITWPQGAPLLKHWFGSNREDDKSLEERTPHLPASREFREMLRKEMHRSDRTLSPLTVLLFDIENVDAEGEKKYYDAEMLRLAQLVPTCLRNTDSVGWFHNGRGLRLGVILYHTAPLMAERVIEDVRRRFKVDKIQNGTSNGHDPEIACEIMAYPGPGVGESEGPQQLSLFGDQNDSRDDRDDSRNGGGGNGSRRPEEAPAPDGTERIARAQRQPVRRQDVRGLSPIVVGFTEAHPLMARDLPIWKRALDLFGAGAGIIVLSPVLLAIAALVRLTSPGPVFFKQERVGHTGKTYLCWKFRTMSHGCDTSKHQEYLKTLINGDDNNGELPMIKLDSGNSQITKIGNILRKTSLDELPQLFNVLKGEMSLVGPRPCLPYEAEEYLRWHTRRFDILPGISGLWQVSGKNSLTFKEMIRLDIQYARRMSLWFDLKILLKTFPTVVHEARKSAAAKSAKKAAPAVEVPQSGNHVEVHHA